MRSAIILLLVGTIWTVSGAAQSRRTTPSENWQLTINLGPCSGFARGTFVALHESALGRRLVGDLDVEMSCQGPQADSAVQVGSGMATANHNLRDDELIITIEDSEGFLKLMSKGVTPMGRRNGTAYWCGYPENALPEVWGAMQEVAAALSRFDDMSSQERMQVVSQGVFALQLTAIHCFKGTFSLVKQ